MEKKYFLFHTFVIGKHRTCKNTEKVSCFFKLFFIFRSIIFLMSDVCSDHGHLLQKTSRMQQ